MKNITNSDGKILHTIFFKKDFPNEKAKIITSIAMFYDLESPGTFVKDIEECGIFVGVPAKKIK